MYGPRLQRIYMPLYRKPYPDYIDRDHPFPRGYKIPEFTLFSGEGSVSALEHMARFTCQCREASNDDYLKLRVWKSSLTGQAFTWYVNLPPNYIFTWEDMQNQFQSHFSRTDPGVSMADLAKIRQQVGETTEQYLMRGLKLDAKWIFQSLNLLSWLKMALTLNWERSFKAWYWIIYSS